MRKANLKMIAYILTGLGMCFLILAVVAFSYSEPLRDYMGEAHPDWGSTYPYRGAGVWALLIVGIVSLVIGLGLVWGAMQEGVEAKPIPQVPPPP